MDPISNIDTSLETLDGEISKIRAEIQKFQQRRHYLSSSLLSSDYVRQQLQKKRDTLSSSSLDLGGADVSPLVVSAGRHRESNYHRVAFSTTTFPFKDPNPHNVSPDLLGVRIDVCARDGRFEKPYYVLLRREKSRAGRDATQPRLAVYRHTIPSFIPTDKIARRYLPMPRQADPREREDETGDGSEVLKPIKAKRQDLSEFVRHLRRELTAWHLRRDSIAWLRERIGIADEGDEELEGRETNDSSILSLAPTSIEARYARLEWRDGRVGRFKLSNSGRVERAVVIGDQGRDKRAEEILTGGDGRVESLPGRLSTIS